MDPVLHTLITLLKTLDLTTAKIRTRQLPLDGGAMVTRIALADDRHKVTINRKDSGHHEITLEKDHGDGCTALHIYPVHIQQDDRGVVAVVQGAYSKHSVRFPAQA